ncbi:MAG: ribbon-helix-helix protein, CopG family [Sporichthyaceae bacterium]
MATNLRLDERAASALRDASRRTGRSQQELLREAIDRYLGLAAEDRSLDRAVASGLVKPPSPFLDLQPRIRLSGALSTLDLLDRDEQR